MATRDYSGEGGDCSVVPESFSLVNFLQSDWYKRDSLICVHAKRSNIHSGKCRLEILSSQKHQHDIAPASQEGAVSGMLHGTVASSTGNSDGINRCSLSRVL